MKLRPNKKHNGQRIEIYSAHWDQTLTGVYTHINGSALFNFYVTGVTNLFTRSDWVIVRVL